MKIRDLLFWIVFTIIQVLYFKSTLAVSYVCTEANQTVICPDCICNVPEIVCPQPNITIEEVIANVYPNQTYDFPMNISYYANSTYCKEILDRIENSTSGVAYLGDNYANIKVANELCNEQLTDCKVEKVDYGECQDDLDVCNNNLENCEDKVITKGYVNWAEVPTKSTYENELQKRILYAGAGGIAIATIYFKRLQKPTAEKRRVRE